MARPSRYDTLASAIARRLASPVRAASPARVASPSINTPASIVASRLAARPAVASPAVNPHRIASAVIQQLASPIQFAPELVASRIASQLSSPARATLQSSEVKTAEIDFEALADQVAQRQKDESEASTRGTTELLASAISLRLRKPTLRLSAVEFQELVEKAADAISRRLAPEQAPVSQLGTDTVDASQALKGEADRKRKKGRSE